MRRPKTSARTATGFCLVRSLRLHTSSTHKSAQGSSFWCHYRVNYENLSRTNPPHKRLKRSIPTLYLIHILCYLHKETWAGMGFDSILQSTPASNPLRSGDKFCKYWCCPVWGIYWCLPGDWQCFSRPKWILENRKQPMPRYIIGLEKHVLY